MYISHKDTNSKYIIKINTISSYFMYMCDSGIITYMYVYTYIHVIIIIMNLYNAGSISQNVHRRCNVCAVTFYSI